MAKCYHCLLFGLQFDKGSSPFVSILFQMNDVCLGGGRAAGT